MSLFCEQSHRAPNIKKIGNSCNKKGLPIFSIIRSRWNKWDEKTEFNTAMGKYLVKNEYLCRRTNRDLGASRTQSQIYLSYAETKP